MTSGKITRSLRRDLFDKLNRLSMAQIDQVTLSSAISRLTTDTNNINQFLNRTQRMGVRAPILLVGGLIMTGPTGTNVNDVAVALIWPEV